MDEEAEQIDELSKKTLGSYRTKAARDDKDRSKGRNLSSAKMYPDQYKKSPLKAKVSATEEVELDEEVGKVTGYFVTGRDNKKTHDKPFTTSSAAIAHADAKETKTGHVHTVHHIKDGKIQKQWQYSDSAGRFAPYNDHAGENHSIREKVELDEVSASTLGSYIRKSSKDADASMKKRDNALDNDDYETARKMGRIARKRDKGTDMAMDKLKGTRYAKVHATEEADLDEAQSMKDALKNSLAKPEPGSKLDNMIKSHNRAIKGGATIGSDHPDLMSKAPSGHHFNKKGMVTLGEEADDASTIAKHTKPLRMKLSQFRNQE